MFVPLFQVYGRLPFDDSDHKKLLKQVQTKIAFPPKPEVSEKCRILIIKILSKNTDRVPLRNIKADPWFRDHLVYFDSEHPRFQNKIPKLRLPPELEDTGSKAAGSSVDVGGGKTGGSACVFRSTVSSDLSGLSAPANQQRNV